MLHTPLCTLLGIEFPIIQAGMGAFTSAELAAAVSNAGGLGSVGTFLRPVEELPQQLARSSQDQARAPAREACVTDGRMRTMMRESTGHFSEGRLLCRKCYNGEPRSLR